MQENNKFYVYIHTRATIGGIFYVGKGHGKRAWSKESRNQHWHRIVRKYDYNVIIVEDDLTEQEAFALEMMLIASINKQNLANMTDGGEGSSGCILSEETRQKMSEAHKGKTLSEEHKRKMSEAAKGKNLSEEHKRKFIESNTGRKRSEETRQKISESLKGNKQSPETIAKRTATRAANRLLKKSQNLLLP